MNIAENRQIHNEFVHTWNGHCDNLGANVGEVQVEAILYKPDTISRDTVLQVYKVFLGTLGCLCAARHSASRTL